MAENLLIGILTMMLCVSIQCVFAGLLLHLMVPFERWLAAGRPTMLGAWVGLSVVLVVMFAGNLLQIALWSGLFVAVGEFDEYATALYHSTVNFTTLGYGDLVMSERRRLLGALEAANGVLMFGLTTSALFAVMEALIRSAWKHRQSIGTPTP